MLVLCYRNLLLYFRNKTEVFFSLLAALISFILFVAFLKDNIAGSWGAVPNHQRFLDLWLISGTLAITGITTTLSALSQKVEDQEKKTTDDLKLTGISHFALDFAYILSATVIGFVMQVAVFIVIYLYFHLVDDLNIKAELFLPLLLVMFIGALLGAVVNAIVMMFVKNRNTLSAVASVVGTVSGFLVGAYIPVGILPDFAQWLVKLTPGAYVGSLFRQLLLNDDLKKFFPAGTIRDKFSEQLGVQLKWGELLDLQQTLMIALFIFVALLVILLVEEYLSTPKKSRVRA